MKTDRDLKLLLNEIDHRGYPAYKETRGSYRFKDYILNIEHVQGDPFAAPSKLSIAVDGRTAGFPEEFYREKHRRIALADLLLRGFGRVLSDNGRIHAGSGKSGLIACSRPGQEILERSALVIGEKDGRILVRFEVGFPAAGRSIRSGELIKILFEFLPEAVGKSLIYKAYKPSVVSERMELSDSQKAIRGALAERGLAAFVADGSILPRESGVSARPMRGAVPFISPESLRVTMELPNGKSISGMGIRKGITLIIGGGYHGKSTLLKALEMGVYDHIRGDGREYVITDPTAVKIRAEDGRSVRGTDISMFINNLPNGKDTKAFYTEDASGSTSEAANVVEALSMRSSLLLIDEDTCATNFMVRDALMQQVVSRDREPITPFIEKMRAISDDLMTSIVLVAGSQGEFFHTADTVLLMDNYVPADITAEARAKAAAFSKGKPALSPVETEENRRILPEDAFISPVEREEDRRIPLKNSRMCGDRVKTKVLGKDAFMTDHETVDIRYVEQVADVEQTAAIAKLLPYLHRNVFDGKRSLTDCMDILKKLLDDKGFEFLDGGRNVPGNLAMPRIEEVCAAVNRCRWTEMKCR